jgi:hypothetical protein
MNDIYCKNTKMKKARLQEENFRMMIAECAYNVAKRYLMEAMENGTEDDALLLDGEDDEEDQQDEPLA